MYILSVSVKDRHFNIGSKFKVIREESNYYIIKTNAIEELEVYKECGAFRNGQIKLINQRGNTELFERKY